MIIIPTNPSAKGPVTLSGIYASNSVTCTAGDLLMYSGYIAVVYGYNVPLPAGFTRLTPNPQFTNANHGMGWKIADSTGSTVNIASGGYVFVFKNGVSIGSYGLTTLTWTDPAQYFYDPSITLKNSDGSSYLLCCSAVVGPAAGYSVNLNITNGSYAFHQNPNSAITTSGGAYHTYTNQGLVALIEIANS